MTGQSLEAEHAGLGSILIDSRCLGTVARILRPQDFGMELNQELYQAILRLDRAGKSVDPVTVLDEALRSGVEDPRSYLLGLMDITPTAANVEEYARIVREGALRRGAAGVSEYIAGELSAHSPTQDILMEAARRIEALQKEGVEEELLDPDSAILAFYDHRERVYQGENAAYVRTGYQDLDEQLGGGMLNGGMYVLAARPGMGKTTLAVNIADRAAQNGKKVLFVSLEMDPEQIEAKRIARETGIAGSRLLMKALTEAEETLVAGTADTLRALPVYFNRRETVTVAQVERMARRVKGLGLIVIDYIGKVHPEPQGRKSGRTEYMTEVSGDIKSLARRFHVPILALCQLNRALADRKDPTPILSDLRDTGAIEQDADGVIFLHQTGCYKTSSGGEASDLRVIVAKNRHGPVGECLMTFDLSASKLTTSRRRPAARRAWSPEPLGPTQMSWEDVTQAFDRNMPFGGKDGQG